MPGPRNPHPVVGRGELTDLNSYNNYPSSIMGRARVRNPGPHILTEPLLCPHTHGPSACVGVI